MATETVVITKAEEPPASHFKSTGVILPTDEEFAAEIQHKRALQAYYESWESYLGYQVGLNGAQHWGFDSGNTAWPSIPNSIRR
jgi:hypothetical protein